MNEQILTMSYIMFDFFVTGVVVVIALGCGATHCQDNTEQWKAKQTEKYISGKYKCGTSW